MGACCSSNGDNESKEDALNILEALPVIDATDLPSIEEPAPEPSQNQAEADEVAKDADDAKEESPSFDGVKEPIVEDTTSLQIEKFTTHEGFFAALDQSTRQMDDATKLRLYGFDDSSQLSDTEIQDKVNAFRERVIRHQSFSSSRVVGCFITEKSLDTQIGDISCSTFLWSEKQILPILRYGTRDCLQAEKNGVQLIKMITTTSGQTFDAILTKACEENVVGVKVRSLIKLPNAVGIKGLVDQQFQVAQRIADKGMVPILQPEIDIDSPDKIKCEQVLIDVMIDALDQLSSDIKVALVVTLPTTPNLYLPLTKHARILRVAALSGGYDRNTACKMLKQNVGVVASFARGLSEGLSLTQSDEDFDKYLERACHSLFEASHSVSEAEEKMARIADHAGFVVAITPRSLRGLLSVDQQKSSSADMLLKECFKRMVLSERFNSARVFAVTIPIAFLRMEIQGEASPLYLWKQKGIVTFHILSTDLECEDNGVQLSQVPTDCSAVLDEAIELGTFGVQIRGLIRKPDQQGIDSLVKQQFTLGKNIMMRGLLPNMLLEVSVEAEDKALCETILLNSILNELGSLTPDELVSLAVVTPAKANLYVPLIEHPNVVRVGAPSGGNQCMDACRALSENVGIIGFFGRAFTEALRYEQSDEEFNNILNETCKLIHQASVAVSAREEQMKKISDGEGFFAILDNSGSAVNQALKRYGIDVEKLGSQQASNKKMHQMITRIVTNDKFSGSQVIATALSEDSIDATISGLPTAKYLWNQKGTVPFLKIDQGLKAEADGVQLMKIDLADTTKISALLDRAAANGFFGTKQRSYIKSASVTGIRALVDQQIELSRYVNTKGLLPMIQPEVDIKSTQKAECEAILLEVLLDALEKLRSDEKVSFMLTLPTKPNLYLPLLGHPNVLRLVALSGGYNQKEACKMLKGNLNMIAGFGRAFVEGMSAKQKDAEFAKVLARTCTAAIGASKIASPREEQLTKLKNQRGFFAGFDQDATSMPKLLQAYGIPEKSLIDETTLMEFAHALHSRILTNPQFNGSRCIGVIMTESTLALNVARLPAAKYIWEVLRIVPFLKVDKGLAPEEDGVCLMREMKNLDARLDKACASSLFGTITRSVIRLPSSAGIRSIVKQQIDMARHILSKGLVPILQIEVDIKSPDKGKCEVLLVNALCRALDEFPPDQTVILDLSLPKTAGTYERLINHRNVIRVAALSGGYDRKEACNLLEQNVGMIASFGRALTEGLRITQTEKEFTHQIVEVCKILYESSRLSDATDKP